MECPYCNGTGTSNVCVNGHFKICTYCNGTGEVFKCPECGEFAYLNNWGSLFDHDYAWYNIECEKCGYRADGGTDPQKAKEMFTNGTGNIPKPLTEQEYLQTCTTEQLAKAILFFCPSPCEICNIQCADGGMCTYSIALKTIMEWLKKPHPMDV